MKVILDTTVLTEDPNFKKTEMIVLRRLCNEEKIKLMITETVYREFCTQRQEKVKNTGNNCLSELKKFDNTVYGIYKREIENVIKIIENGIYNSDKIIKEKIDYYIKQTKATILKPTIDDYNEVFERYFKGDKPFKKIKSRDDILDAIIFVQTKRMKEKRLVFISHDNKLREVISNEEIIVYPKLSDFIYSDIIKEYIDINENDNKIYNYLPNILDSKKLIETFYNTLEEELINKTIIDDKINGDNNEGTISGIVGINDIVFNKDDINILGSCLFTISFYCEIEAYIDYYIDKTDYYDFNCVSRNEIFVEDWNDHFFQAEENYILNCTGQLGLQFCNNIIIEENINKDIEMLLETITISLSDIEIIVFN